MEKIAVLAHPTTILVMPSNNLKLWRESRDMSREQLAERLDISLASISRIESGKQQPREDVMEKILAIFQKKRADFWGDASNVSPVEMGSVKVPIVDYDEAVLFSAEKAPNFLDDKNRKYILTDGEHSGMAFSLVIKGESMTPMFKEGDMIVVDPAVAPGPGDYVVANEKGGEVTFRKYRAIGVNDSGKDIYELVPLNNDYATLRSDMAALEIRGTMMEHRTYRRR